MLTKKKVMVETYSYFFNGEGPYETETEAVEVALSKHLYYDNNLHVEDFLNDKKLLIALGEWAKNS